MSAPWVTYRPELKVLDCTIRDGGLVNDHQFDDDLVKAVYETCVEAGLDYMEIGYRNSKRLFPKKEFGPFRHSDEEDIRRITGDHDPQATGLKLSVMADAGKSDWSTDILPSDQSVVDLIRVACYVDQIPEAVEMIHDAHEKGYETSCNLMAISIAQQPVSRLHPHVSHCHRDPDLAESFRLACVGHDQPAEGRELQGDNVIAVPERTVYDYTRHPLL